MGAGPIARIGDKVYFPKCGVYTIISGSSNFMENWSPVAHVGDAINVPGLGIIIQGSSTLIDGGRNVARIGDKAFSKKCGTGFIISGSPSFLES
jgi:uncharacterized Zn-binding protein involved in type VI secretion